MHGRANRESVITNKAGDAISHIVHLGHFNEYWDVVEEDAIMRVIVPRNDWHTALRLHHVGRRGVVNDNGIFHIATYLTHIFDKDAIDEGAMFTEQSGRAVTSRIHHVHQRIGILGERCSVDYKLEILGHLLQEVFDSWALHDVYI